MRGVGDSSVSKQKHNSAENVLVGKKVKLGESRSLCNMAAVCLFPAAGVS